MARGRKPRPSYLQGLTGETRPSRVNKDEPEVPAGITSKPPSYLTGEALKEWKRIVPLIQEWTAEIDLGTVAAYCVAHGEFVRLAELVQAEGHRCEAANGGAIRNPNSSAWGMAQLTRRQMAETLGFTPSSRTKVKTIGKPRGADPYEAFKAGK